MTIVYDEEDKSTARAGDNVKLKLKGVEEDVSTSIFIFFSQSFTDCH